MAERDSRAAAGRAARQLMQAILRARPELDARLQGVLSSEVAWALAVLIASWRASEAPLLDLTPYRDVTRQFDLYADTLLRFREAAVGAKNDLDLAGASGYFLSAVSQIGPRILRYVLESRTFAKIEQEILALVPPPSPLAFIQEPSERTGRTRRYLGFDYRPRAAQESAAPESAALESGSASAEDLTRWQRELQRTDLAPEMRWLYEQKLLANQVPGYGSEQAARASWQAALTQTQSPPLRAYFAENLKTLERT